MQASCFSNTSLVMFFLVALGLVGLGFAFGFGLSRAIEADKS